MKLSRAAGYEDFRELARQRLPKAAFDYFEGGAGEEITAEANHHAFRRRFFEPRNLVDVSTRTIATTVLGAKLTMPALLAPVGLARLAHGEGEIAAARAAHAAGTVFSVSVASSIELERIAAAADGALWFQIYLWRDEDLVRRLVDRARVAQCTALIVTIDVPVVGHRERDTRNGAALPMVVTPRTLLDAIRHPSWTVGLARHGRVRLAHLAEQGDSGTVRSVASTISNPAATWERLTWLRGVWDGPLVVKGIMSPGDAVKAVESGADAICVSNHGGRQLDGVPATLDVLQDIAIVVPDSVDVLLDGGIRRGADVVKACALGARACLVGRAWAYGLAASGEAGVARMLELLRADVDRTVALLGCTSIEEVDCNLLRT